MEAKELMFKKKDYNIEGTANNMLNSLMKKYNISKLVIVLLWIIAALLSFNFGLYEIEKASKPLCNIVIGAICLYCGKTFVDIAKDIWENCK